MAAHPNPQPGGAPFGRGYNPKASEKPQSVPQGTLKPSGPTGGGRGQSRKVK